MNTLAVIAIGFVVIVIVVWVVIDLLSNASNVIAPDEYDRREIIDEFGEGSAEAKDALEQRFGENAHWRDARTALGAILGIAVTFWIIFG